jgi:dihydroorotase-like cyclic amidohydrolase
METWPMSEVEVVVDTFDERYRELRLVRPSSVLTMRESLERCGQLTATIAVRCEDEKLALLDGFKRLDAVRHLGRQMLRTRIVEMSEQAALESDQLLLLLIERARHHTDDLLEALKELEGAARTKENP